VSRARAVANAGVGLVLAGQLTVPVQDNGQKHLCSPYTARGGLVLILYLPGTAYALHYCGWTSSGQGENVRS
jgi:hypothetical protein